MNRLATTLFWVFAGASITGGGPALAADAKDKIEVITVTALKRETDLFDTPMAIAAFNGSDLEKNGQSAGLEKFLQFAPGVTVNHTTNGTQTIFIRGLASSYGNSPIGFYIDDVPFTSLTTTTVPDVRAWDLERVEVLRGPQGTLYGASSLGGTIRVLTNNPVLNEFQAKGDFTGSGTDGGGGNYGAKGAVNVPLVEDKLALRVSGTQEDFPGWITYQNPFTGVTKSHFNDFRVWTGRAKLLYRVNDDAEIGLSFWRNDSNSPADNVANDDGVRLTSTSATFRTNVKSNLYGGNIKYNLGAATLTSSTSYYDSNGEVLFSDFPDSYGNDNHNIFNQEVRLTSNGDGRLFWTAGGIYTKNETFFPFKFNLPGFFVNTSTQDNRSTSYAIYGEGTYSLTDTVDTTLGLRYYSDSVRRNDTQFSVPQPEVNAQFTDWSPRYNVAWRPIDNVLVYGTVSKGFRSGMTQPSIALAASGALGLGIEDNVDAEDAWNYEIGSKLTLADGRVTIDGVLYYIDWTNLQQNILVNPVVFAFVNAGDASGYGFEWAATFEPVDALVFSFSGNVNETTYSETVRNAVGVVVFSDGDQVQYVPEFSLAGSIDYGHELGGGWTGVARTSVEYVGKRSTTSNTFVRNEGQENTRVDLRLGATKGDVGLFFFVDNLTDNDDRINVPGTQTAFDAGNASRYRPRTIGLNLQVNY